MLASVRFNFIAGRPSEWWVKSLEYIKVVPKIRVPFWYRYNAINKMAHNFENNPFGF